ncbi:transmembrane protein 14C-like [Lineus longissimus]|uniref:transmembrane protein 14C-like n=1 Tax=Lineus longissimus TaxID=88925 RepID=UPI002B4EA372
MALDIVGFGYATIVALGGIVGYMKAGSTISLVMGVTCGSLLGLGSYLMTNNPNNVYLSLAVSSLLTGVMGYRFSKSGKFMPAGMVAVLSLVMVMRLAPRLMK